MRSLLTLALIFVMSTALLAQHDGYRYVGYNGLSLPQSSMTLADVVDILTDYSIAHQDRIVGGPYIGLTEFDKKRITIDDSMDQSIRRSTVIHELLHVWYLKHANIATGGYDAGESAIALETGRLYEQMFVKIPLNVQCYMGCEPIGEIITIQGIQGIDPVPVEK